MHGSQSRLAPSPYFWGSCYHSHEIWIWSKSKVKVTELTLSITSYRTQRALSKEKKVDKLRIRMVSYALPHHNNCGFRYCFRS